MAKKDLYFDSAERMYVIEQKTFAEIASQLDVSERTLSDWKAEGEWDAKRAQYLESRQSFHEELYEFSRTLMKSIKRDLDNEKQVDSGRLYALCRLLPNVQKVKDYEDVLKSKAEEIQRAGLPEDVLELIQSEILGIK